MHTGITLFYSLPANPPIWYSCSAHYRILCEFPLAVKLLSLSSYLLFHSSQVCWRCRMIENPKPGGGIGVRSPQSP